MTYLYENSNAERFQQLCQSLLLPEYPLLQCFPVGQRDGGRDGLDPETQTILQVKFKRADEAENADWLIESLEGELPKILKLVARGAKRYIMMTNARGTAHLDGGRIDRVQAWFDANLPIPATCLWRDEVDRRLDDASAGLKLKYSEVLALEDGIELVFNLALGSDSARQQDALRSFVAAQFEKDRTVKFKQVSLSNDLLDLFIDVPIGFPRKAVEDRSATSGSRKLKSFFAAAGMNRTFMFDDDGAGPELYIESDTGGIRRFNLGAAEVLLGEPAQHHLKLVVLEGAPGQGKSTLAQYVCQIHRAKYLNKHRTLSGIPASQKQSGFRIPLKVDLRDYAAFLAGHSPFGIASDGGRPLSLDVFLAQLISYQSGGIDYNSHDLLGLVKSVPTLLFLDGLDEVADLNARESLINSLGEALARWGEFDADVQVVITSRPSVFGRPLSFDRFGFTTLTLQNIDSARVNEYADKWISARGLDPQEKLEVKKILREKLELAHIRDLTRNPMQLTILLSLIHQIGHSLPDQRTDLYSRYVDLFLTREADKSLLVRENRQILLEFIEFLAWTLQSEAESEKTAGSVSAATLQALAESFLESGGQPSDLAHNLFGGGLERIFVLVERIEGLYEFEVQPLREFFCAQYLYSTAPVGTYRVSALRGDRAQRFEALASNPFWLNVCRFYAGCYERGEIASIILSLEEMIQTGSVAVSQQARRVGLALLQDWVFSSVKYPQARLIRAVFDGAGVQMLLFGEMRGVDEMRLDKECGRDVLRDELFSHLRTRPIGGRTSALCYLIKLNGGSGLQSDFSELLKGTVGPQRSSLLLRMMRSGAMSSIEPAEAWALVDEDSPGEQELGVRCSEMLRAEPNLAISMPGLVDRYPKIVLRGLAGLTFATGGALAAFATMMTVGPWHFLRLQRMNGWDPVGRDQLREGDRTPLEIVEFVSLAANVDVEPERFYNADEPALEVWSSTIEAARSSFGENWGAFSLALRAAGSTPSQSLPSGAELLFEPSIPLALRARHARLRRSGPDWWRLELQKAASQVERAFWAAMVICWSPVKCLFDLQPEVDEIVTSLDVDGFEALKRSVTYVAEMDEKRADRRRLEVANLSAFNPSSAILVALALRKPLSNLRFGKEQSRVEPLKSYLSQARKLDEVSVPPSWKDNEAALDWAREIEALEWRPASLAGISNRHLREARLTADSAELVVESVQEFPAELVARASSDILRRYRPRSLSSTAREQNWSFGV